MLVTFMLHNNPYATQFGINPTPLLSKLTLMMLNSVDKRLSKTERDLWQRQGWMMAKRIEGDNKECYAKHERTEN